jgi:hypothetical protein
MRRGGPSLRPGRRLALLGASLKPFARALVRSTLARGVLVVFLLISYLHATRLQTRLAILDATPAPVPAQKPRIFIASLHWNTEVILRSRWNDAVVNLVRHLGVENVYFSAYESGSWDDTKLALTELDERLAQLELRRTVLLNEKTHADELMEKPGPGWVMTSRGRKELRRIPYLSRLRNLSLEPLRDLKARGTTFDWVLFLGDVAFTVSRPR